MDWLDREKKLWRDAEDTKNSEKLYLMKQRKEREPLEKKNYSILISSGLIEKLQQIEKEINSQTNYCAEMKTVERGIQFYVGYGKGFSRNRHFAITAEFNGIYLHYALRYGSSGEKPFPDNAPTQIEPTTITKAEIVKWIENVVEKNQPYYLYAKAQNEAFQKQIYRDRLLSSMIRSILSLIFPGIFWLLAVGIIFGVSAAIVLALLWFLLRTMFEMGMNQ